MRFAACVAGLAALVTAGCGGGGGGNSCSPGATATITISATVVTPNNVCVEPNGAVTFANSDANPHTVTFPANCPAAASVPAGQSVPVTFPTQGNCPYTIDGSTSTALQGTVAVTTVTVTGGY